ncbi:UNVERIFIED_CONTAM: hypothetical protein Scaly_3148600 [Sesamum calycinum]|uniref:Uncharacterized protein n=1 Tax=Sesamum calycinum TaxID=2727403 RepID=A0AAW2JHH7_9LAMI
MDARALRRKDAFRGERPWGDTVCDPWISDRETRLKPLGVGAFQRWNLLVLPIDPKPIDLAMSRLKRALTGLGGPNPLERMMSMARGRALNGLGWPHFALPTPRKLRIQA